jgi:predicted phosphodiesterase
MTGGEGNSKRLIAVLSDIHANARALRAGISSARDLGVDEIVFLGDLFTYGVDVTETLDLVLGEVDSGAILLTGNHDRLYLDMQAGIPDYYDTLSPWIRESVDVTLGQLGGGQLASLPWIDECVRESVLLSHANPFGPGDWTYLDHETEKIRARSTLAERGHAGGVFGHTHRALIECGVETPWLANPGSVGQPRGGLAASTFLLLDLSHEQARGQIVPIEYDVAGHVRALWDSAMSEPTRRRLCSFFSREASS